MRGYASVSSFQGNRPCAQCVPADGPCARQPVYGGGPGCRADRHCRKDDRQLRHERAQQPQAGGWHRLLAGRLCLFRHQRRESHPLPRALHEHIRFWREHDAAGERGRAGLWQAIQQLRCCKRERLAAQRPENLPERHLPAGELYLRRAGRHCQQHQGRHDRFRRQNRHDQIL